NVSVPGTRIHKFRDPNPHYGPIFFNEQMSEVSETRHRLGGGFDKSTLASGTDRQDLHRRTGALQESAEHLKLRSIRKQCNTTNLDCSFSDWNQSGRKS